MPSIRFYSGLEFMIKFICYPKCITCQKNKTWLDDKEIEYELKNIQLDNSIFEELTI